MSGRQLALSKCDNFFSDPIFADILSLEDAGLKNKLDLFKQNQLVSAGGNEEPHNLQVTASNDRFMVQLELPGFQPEEFSLKTREDFIVLEANHKGNTDGGDEITERKYTKEFKMPQGVDPNALSSSYSASGILTIEAPRVLTAPDGATVSESMAAKSKAYTTDDGKTSVKEAGSSSNQMMAATTESPDGSTKSSMSFSSSNSSSSSTVTSSDGGGSMPSLGGMPAMPGMPPMPALSMGGGPGADMDAMMKKMMGDMSIGGDMSMGGGASTGMASSSSMMSSSSSMMSSSSSSTESSTMMSGGGMPGMGGMPAMGGMGGLNIEELSTAGTDFGGPPNFPSSITSPPPSVAGDAAPSSFPSSTSHSVKPAADFKVQADPQADCTVLLKLKGGNEYKLVLNMQQYKPENITVKLNDRELTVSALEGNTEGFTQRHKVPEGIDLDQLTSSFSADGILVIKAPKAK